MLREANDGTVTVSSQLPLNLQCQAANVQRHDGERSLCVSAPARLTST